MDDATPLRLPALPPAAGDAPVAVALSGGLDSRALLQLLAEDAAARARGLRALHVHHGLHPDADAWAARCVAACEALGLPCRVLWVTVDRESGLGLEGAAREARFAALAEALGRPPVLIFGPGDPARIHKPDETCSAQAIATACAAYTEMMLS